MSRLRSLTATLLLLAACLHIAGCKREAPPAKSLEDERTGTVQPFIAPDVDRVKPMTMVLEEVSPDAPIGHVSVGQHSRTEKSGVKIDTVTLLPADADKRTEAERVLYRLDAGDLSALKSSSSAGVDISLTTLKGKQAFLLKMSRAGTYKISLGKLRLPQADGNATLGAAVVADRLDGTCRFTIDRVEGGKTDPRGQMMGELRNVKSADWADLRTVRTVDAKHPGGTVEPTLIVEGGGVLYLAEVALNWTAK